MKQLTFVFLCFFLYFSGNSQVTVEFDTYHPSNSTYQTVSYQNAFLENGSSYLVTVNGTFSPWPPNDWNNPCGTFENSPIIPSTSGYQTGTVGHDFAFNYAMPNSSSCNQNPVFPRDIEAFSISIDGGVSWFFPTINENYNANHSYTFNVVGNGLHLMVRNNDYVSSDNYGKLSFLIEQLITSNTSLTEIPTNNNQFELYPNPASKLIHITKIDTEAKQGFIYDSKGRKVKTFNINNESELRLNINDLHSGMYFIKIGKQHQKLIIHNPIFS